MSPKQNENAFFTIITAAAHLKLSPQYVRKAVRAGELKSTLKPVEGRDVKRHEILPADLETWRKGIGARIGRADGRNKFVFYATPEELVALKKVAPDLDVQKAFNAEAHKAAKARRAAKLATAAVTTK